jgi:hypothetical protein
MAEQLVQVLPAAVIPMIQAAEETQEVQAVPVVEAAAVVNLMCKLGMYLVLLSGRPLSRDGTKYERLMKILALHRLSLGQVSISANMEWKKRKSMSYL